MEGPLSTNRGPGWEALRLRPSNIFISNSFRRIRGEQRNSVVVSRIIAPGLERTGLGMKPPLLFTRLGLKPLSRGSLQIRHILTLAPLFNPISGRFVCDRHALSSMEGLVVWLQKVADCDLEAFASRTIQKNCIWAMEWKRQLNDAGWGPR